MRQGDIGIVALMVLTVMAMAFVPDRVPADGMLGLWVGTDEVEADYTYRVVANGRGYRLEGDWPGKAVRAGNTLTVTWDYVSGHYQFYGKYELINGIWQGHYWQFDDYKIIDTWRRCDEPD